MTNKQNLKKRKHGLRKGKLKRETESLLMAVQNYTIRIVYVNVK